MKRPKRTQKLHLQFYFLVIFNILLFCKIIKNLIKKYILCKSIRYTGCNIYDIVNCHSIALKKMTYVKKISRHEGSKIVFRFEIGLLVRSQL